MLLLFYSLCQTTPSHPWQITLRNTRKDADEVKQEIANPEALEMRWKLAKTIAERRTGKELG